MSYKLLFDSLLQNWSYKSVKMSKLTDDKLKQIENMDYIPQCVKQNLWELHELACLFITVVTISENKKREGGVFVPVSGNPSSLWGRSSDRGWPLLIMSHCGLQAQGMFQSKKPTEQDIISLFHLLRPPFAIFKHISNQIKSDKLCADSNLCPWF